MVAALRDKTICIVSSVNTLYCWMRRGSQPFAHKDLKILI